MKILVTGGSGLVGSGIKRVTNNYSKGHYLYEGREFYFATSSDGNLVNYEETKSLFEKIKPTHVIHLAAKVGGLFSNLRQNVEFFNDNMDINRNVLHCCYLYKVEKCISCLSTCIFPNKTTYPIDETMIHNGEPHESNIGYSYAKRMIDVINHCYNTQYGCNFTSIIPTNIYGPNDNFNIEDGHVIPGLIHKCYLAKEKNEDFVIWGTGTPLRQFIYADDLARLILWCLDNYDNHEPIILSVDEEDEVSIKEVALLVAKHMNFEGNIVFDSSKSDGQFKKTANNKKLRSIYPDYKFQSIENGIKTTCDWFKKNFENARK